MYYISTQQARVGKTAVARWDLRQRELKALQQQQEQQEQQLLQQQQQQLSSSTPGNEQQYAFGHHGFCDVRESALFASALAV
jgi:hypothetical protein